jgi:hypothetical protein
MASFFWTKNPYFAVAFAPIAIAWIFFAPKPLPLNDFLYPNGNSRVIVPDDLLAKLAERKSIPEWVKADLAKTLQKHRKITFLDLRTLSDELTFSQHSEERAQGVGYKRLMQHHQRKPE